MSLHNVAGVARYEVKLLRRSWLFRIFSVLALVAITMMHLGSQSNMINQGGMYRWDMVALSCSIPFVNVYIFNIAQSIIAIFLAGDFMKRDKKLDTAEVIYVRPVSNTEYIAGKTWGVIRVFVSLNVLALAVAAFINVFASESGFDPWVYFFYLFTLSVPSLVFVLGVSFLVTSLARNQAITMVLLLGYVGVTLVYLGEEGHGAFDFFAVTLPNVFSGVLGHPGLSLYLLQRGAFLLVGVGALALTVMLMNRLPQRAGGQVRLVVAGCLLACAGAVACGVYLHDFQRVDAERAGLLARYRQYASSVGVTLEAADLSLRQQGERIDVRANLRLCNREDQTASPVLLYLNPSLEVTRLVDAGGGALSFRRDGQVVVVETTLEPRQEMNVVMDYAGEVSESVCYLDVPEKEFYDTKTGNSVLRFGKHYAFVGDRFTLLTPESMWYPVGAAPVNPESLYNIRKDFTRFSLRVVDPRQPMVLSQGSARDAGDTLVFEPESPLSSISLVMGDYERKGMMLDSLEIALYYFKGHDYFSEDLPLISDTLASTLRWMRDDYEVRKNRDYPFRRLTLVETPVSFATYVRNWRGASDYVQPEMIFLPEMGVTLPRSSFKLAKRQAMEWERRGNRSMEEIDLEIRVVRDFVQNAFLNESAFAGEGNLFVPNLMNNAPGWNSKLNKYDISPLFFNYATFVRSPDFPIMDVLLNVLLKQESVTNAGWMSQFAGMNDAQRAAEYLKERSFEQAVMDDVMAPEVFKEVLKLKATYLKNYVLTRHDPEKFSRFMKEFFLQHEFSAVNFTELNDAFTREFEINLMDLIPEWYTVNRTPLFVVRGVNAEETTIDDYTRYIVSFHVYNPTTVEGILSVRTEGGGGRGGGGGGYGGGGGFMLQFSISNNSPLQYLISPHSYKKVRMLVDDRPNNLSIGTNIAQNLPGEMGLRLPRMRTITTDTTTGVFAGDSTLFMYDPKEITVDNEDEGFRLIESNQKHVLQSLLNITTEDRYKNMNFWAPPSRWTATVGNNFHGDYIKSGYYKRVGSGKNMAEWQANISLPGFYDVLVYNPMIESRGFGRNEDEMHQYYVVTHADGEDEVSMQTNENRQSWVSVGSFYFDEGEAKITLVDRGSSSRQLIFADAVRWVYKNNQR
ncbi:MAG: hypothetical protein LBI96_02490 [Odoribacteraceae bacterium]|jgi:hypothetical protein|nr:hypothetical protein [Odoribacteraceae bacterium]